MRFVLKFDCDNAAFGEDDNDLTIEANRILREVGKWLESEGGAGRSANVRDLNGNTVGCVLITEREDA